MKRETAEQRRQRELRVLIDDWSIHSEAVKQMIRIVCTEEGATSLHHLLDVNRKAFDMLYEGARTLITELGVDE